MTAAAKLSTGPFSASKKSGRKRENPPCTPYKRKARGKEYNPDAIGTGLSAGAGAGMCERIRAREALRKRSVEAAVEDAPVADRDKPKILQALITPFWMRGAK